MANSGRPRQQKRKLLMSTTLNVFLYGAELSADSLWDNNRYKAGEKATQMVVPAYHTVSGEAAPLKKRC